jgi:hypothetical protein
MSELITEPKTEQMRFSRILKNAQKIQKPNAPHLVKSHRQTLERRSAPKHLQGRARDEPSRGPPRSAQTATLASRAVCSAEQLPQRHRPTRPAPPLDCTPAKNLKPLQAHQTPKDTPLLDTNDQQSTTPGNSNPSHLRCLYDNGTCALRLFHSTVIRSSQSRRPTLGTSPAFAITAPALPSSSVSISNCRSKLVRITFGYST